ncbi:hypothetical protein P4606_10660 [Priestia aryabhattai]|uniref:hypothetical protein n=1 Tax=Priestia aryabhattai TaxID=412384 RepID=UPI002E2093D6|nr:hypothetical protein [Priestia aryabhattai]
MSTLDVFDVFTAGGMPSVTYNERTNLGLVKRLSQRLGMKGKVLSITGPTKIGKTVLWKKVIPEDKRVHILGGSIRKEEDIWDGILSKLNGYVKWTEEQSEEEEKKRAEAVGAGAEGTIMGVFKMKANYTNTGTTGEKQTTKTAISYSVPPMHAALYLLTHNDLILIIDDFHYIDKEVQANVIRALKDPVAEGLKLIISSVPHRDHDALKAEKEMTGRVYQLKVPAWDVADLREIAEKGFNALNLKCAPEIIDTFITESYQSPHLMQEFCQSLCLENDITTKQDSLVDLDPPSDYEAFFEEIVDTSTSKVIYEKLVAGPPSTQRDRMTRQFKNGSEGDIYVAVMHALAELLHLDSISPDVIKTQLQTILEARHVPELHLIKNTLNQMSLIAKEYVEDTSEPPIDYKDELLHIVDPFFSFYLKWCEK